MGLVINFSSMYEDRFNIALRDINSRVTHERYKLIGKDIGETQGDEETKGINMYFPIHPVMYNRFLSDLSDIQDIMGIQFKFRYAGNEREAYTGQSHDIWLRHKWMKLCY